MRASLVVALLLAGSAAGAIEIDLVANREQRGSLGYVDMQKIFRLYPETLRAKDNFEELVNQAQEQVNLRKVELIRLRSELSQLKQERDYIAKTLPMIAVATATAAPAPPAPAPAPPAFSTETVAPHTLAPPAPPPSVALSTPTAPPPPRALPPGITELPGLGMLKAPPGVSTAPAPKPESLVVNIPGVSTAPVVMQPPVEEAPKASTAAAVSLISTSTAAIVNPALAEFDAKIALMDRELSRKETDFKEYQARQEKNLLDLESRKTEIILGKISRAIQDVAHQEGIGVVVDKSSIVFGHNAVDLTDKVLKRLQGS